MGLAGRERDDLSDPIICFESATRRAFPGKVLPFPPPLCCWGSAVLAGYDGSLIARSSANSGLGAIDFSDMPFCWQM